MDYKKLGDYIEQVERRNSDLKYGVDNVRGVSNNKQFIPTRANNTGRDLEKFYVISPGEFVYNSRTTRMGDKVGLGYNNTEETFLTSWNNCAFRVKKDALHLLNPTYLFIFYNRTEFDRYARYHSWGSSTELFSWDDMCEVEIPIPDVDTQRKYVAIYNGLMKNKKAYEQSLDDLQLICDTYIEDLIKREEKKSLGEYIQQINERNTDLQISLVRGVSIHKKLIETKANMSGVSLHNYKIVRNRQFVFNPNTSRNGEKISIAILDGEESLASSAYTVFEVKDAKELLPEYLYLFFKRTEFDRYARFHSWGSARETFDWDTMCDVKLPIPDIKTQEAIVTIYLTLETRKRLNEELKAKIKPLCPVLMRGVVEGNEIH